MNDTELDEILNQWKDPQVRTAWSTEVRSGLLRKPVRRTFGQWAAGLWPGFGKGLIAVTSAGVCLLIATAAFPQVSGLFSPGVRFVVEGETTGYAENGAIQSTRRTSFARIGIHALPLERTDSDNPLVNLTGGMFNLIHTTLVQVAPSLIYHHIDSDLARHSILLKNGCVGGGWNVIGQETILGHLTTIVRTGGGGKGGTRETQWVAPDLDCAGLKLILEDPRPDGTYYVSYQEHATKITMNTRQ